MYLYKRGAVWWARWTSRGETVRKSTKTKDRDAAKSVVRRWERELADPGHQAEEKTRFVDAAEQFMTEAKSEGLSKGTLNMYDCKLRNLVDFYGPEARLSAVTYESVVRYIAQRRKPSDPDARPVVDYTIHRELTALRRVLSSAMRAQQFKRDPKTVMPRLKPGYEPRKHYLTREQLDALVAHLDPAKAAQVCFVVATSARRGEVERAQRGDCTPGRVKLRGTKTKSSARDVPVISIFEDQMSFALKHADGEKGALFSEWSNMRRDVIAAALRAGVPAVTWNDLRRTCATWLVQSNAPNALVAKILGHTTSVMIDRVYGQQDADSIAHLIERAIVPGVYQSVRNQPKERA